MNCKKCKTYMGMKNIEESDGSIAVIFHCDECGLECQGYYNPEHQDPDPIFWSDE